MPNTLLKFFTYAIEIQVNAEYEVKMKELYNDAQKWKSEAEAGKNFTAQLVEKVKVLEKYEEEVKNVAAKSKDCEKMESKFEVLKGTLPSPLD